MTVSELSSFLQVLIGGVIVTVITAVVAAIRKIKSGNIVDDDAIIARLDKDNIKTRTEREEAKTEAARLAVLFEAERRARWRAEDIATIYKRQLMDAKMAPSPVPDKVEEPTSERP